MSKERVQRLVLGLVVILFVASVLGYLLVPAAMLRIVGMDSDPQVTFLVRTIPPPCWRYLQVPGGTTPGRHLGGSAVS